MAAAGWHRNQRESSAKDEQAQSPLPSGTQDIRIVFGSNGEMGELLSRLLDDLATLRVQISDYTYAESEDEQRRLEAAEMLISSACSFVLLGLDQVVAEDATPFGPETLGWLRAIQRWTGGGGPGLTCDDIHAARAVLFRLAPDLTESECRKQSER